MTCPSCEKDNKCPCDNCIKDDRTNLVIILEDENLYQCSFCGHKFDEQDSLEPIIHNSKGSLVSFVESFKSLMSNWNGPNTEPPSLLTILNTIDLIQNIQPELINNFLSEEGITPTSHGTISLEFENRKGDSVNIEIGDKFYSVYSDIKDYSRNIEIEHNKYLLNFIPQQIILILKDLRME